MKKRFVFLCLFFSQVVYSQSSGTYRDRQSIYRDLFQSPGPLKNTMGVLSMEQEISSDKKNVGLALIYSLLLPGMGELYVGEYGVGKYFTIGEAVLWLTYTSLDLYGNWLRDDARQFAVSHAGIDPTGKADQYFVDIGNFLNTYEYNDKKLRDRELDKLYNINSNDFWRWDSDANRAFYRDLRISHDRVFDNTRFVVAAIIVNHIASAINSARLAVLHNNRVTEAYRIDVHARVGRGLTQPDFIMISVSKKF